MIGKASVKSHEMICFVSSTVSLQLWLLMVKGLKVIIQDCGSLDGINSLYHFVFAFTPSLFSFHLDTQSMGSLTKTRTHCFRISSG